MKTRPLPPHLKRYRSHGTTYTYFRKPGHKTVRLPEPIGGEAFWQAYKVALDAKLEIGAARNPPGSISAMLAAYYGSQAWAVLSEGTQGMRRAILEGFRNRYGPWPLRQITANFFDAYLANLKPHAARNHLKALRGFLKYAKRDVTTGITLPKVRSEKHPSWPAEVMAAYEARHPIGSKARLAFALARYTGQGRSEVAQMGRIVDGAIVIKRQKTKVEATIPVLPQLKAIIEATPLIGLQTFLTTKSGKPYRPVDLSDDFRQWCNQAGIDRKYTIHGLRHAMGDALAELGCTPHEIAAVLAHASAKMALHYTQGADRKRMARTAMDRLAHEHETRTALSKNNPEPGLKTQEAS
jgi:integrase